MERPEPRPLAGRRIVVTRAAGQSGELARLLEEAGARSVLLPVLSFAEPENPAPLDAAIRSLAAYDWLIFTSQNAVRFYFERCKHVGPEAGGSAQVRVAALGEATARSAQALGIHVDFIARQARGLAMAEELREHIAGKRVLLPRSDRARADLPDALRSAGATVTEVVAYRTIAGGPAGADVLGMVVEGDVDAITFASPSAFHALVEIVGMDALRGLAQRVVFAAIGPTTGGAIRDSGLSVLEAAEPGAAGLVQALVEHYSCHSGQGVRRG